MKNSGFRALVAASLLGAFLFALFLAAAPKCHERIHNVTANHDCAVTMFSSGSCDETPCDRISVEAEPPPSLVFFAKKSSIFTATIESSILEHAPPQNS